MSTRSEHTPGPWKSSSHGTTHYSQEEIWGGNHGVAIVLNENPNLRADARLISAAPELLDALKALVNALNNGVIEVIRWNEGEQLIQNAESAIRKAEGE